jgi:hypothetical protein
MSAIRTGLPVTPDRAREVYTYVEETGDMIFNSGPRVGQVAGTVHYRTSGEPIAIYILIDGVRYKAHRIAWFIKKNRWPAELVDHINRNPLDNRWENLRPATHAENSVNRGKKPGCASHFPGVDYLERNKKKPWRARAAVNGVRTHLGCYATQVEAYMVVRDAHIAEYGEHAPLDYDDHPDVRRALELRRLAREAIDTIVAGNDVSPIDKASAILNKAFPDGGTLI